MKLPWKDVWGVKLTVATCYILCWILHQLCISVFNIAHSIVYNLQFPQLAATVKPFYLIGPGFTPESLDLYSTLLQV